MIDGTRADEGPSPGVGEQALGRLGELAARALGFPYGVVVVFDDRSSVRLNPLPVRRRTARAVADWVEEVRRGRTTVMVPDLSADRAQGPAAGLLPATGALMAAPMMVGEDVTGALVLVDLVPRILTADQAGLLEDFARVTADQLALAQQAGVWSSLADASAEARLREAIAGGEIVPHFQPIVDLASGEVLGVEALARWPARAGAGEEPAAFVADAERSGLIVDLDRAVTRAALTALAGWHDAHPGVAVSVNLSGPSLDQPDATTFLVQAAQETAVDPGLIRVELTETVRPSNLAAAGARMEEIRAAGFQVWFDDFGSGWSALSDLVRYPVDGVKIDRSFAEELGTPIDDAVVRAITTAAADLGLRVTIEGVETAEQAQRARELGCDRGQGYFWARPMAAADLDVWLAARKVSSRDPSLR